MMENRSLLLALFSFFSAFIVGLAMSYNSWNGIFFVYTGSADKRQPAAINKIFDYSHLEGAALRMAAQERLVSAANVNVSPNDVQIALGHFVTRSDAGRKVLACQRYNKIELEFTAPGIAVNGYSPTMIVESPCRENEQDINLMATIQLPLGELYANPPSGNFEQQFFGDMPITMRLEHLGSEWPQQWTLNSVKLLDDNSGLTISPSDLRSISRKLEFSFSK